MNREDFYKLYFITMMEMLLAVPMLLIAYFVLCSDILFTATIPLAYFVLRGLDYLLELGALLAIQKAEGLVCYIEKGSKTLKGASVLCYIYSLYIVWILATLSEF